MYRASKLLVNCKNITHGENDEKPLMTQKNISEFKQTI